MSKTDLQVVAGRFRILVLGFRGLGFRGLGCGDLGFWDIRLRDLGFGI